MNSEPKKEIIEKLLDDFSKKYTNLEAKISNYKLKIQIQFFYLIY